MRSKHTLWAIFGGFCWVLPSPARAADVQVMTDELPPNEPSSSAAPPAKPPATHCYSPMLQVVGVGVMSVGALLVIDGITADDKVLWFSLGSAALAGGAAALYIGARQIPNEPNAVTFHAPAPVAFRGGGGVAWSGSF